MIDHISIPVMNLARSRRFYDATLAPLGIVPGEAGDAHASYSKAGSDDFSLHAAETSQGTVRSPQHPHYAFTAPSRPAVDRFHAQALENGGFDDGKPGLRPEYHADYYAAFVLDPDGHRIEAVCHLDDSGEDRR